MIFRSDAVQGTFAGMPEGFNLGSNFLGTGLTANITYVGGDGNDVSIKLSAGSIYPWHNPARMLDVNDDTQVTPADALGIINYINAFGSGLVPAKAVLGQPYGFLDSNPDNVIAPNDVVAVINFINAFGSGLPGPGGEGESDAAIQQLLGAPSTDDLGGLIATLAADATYPAAQRRRQAW